jgi:hypothetical protein
MEGNQSTQADLDVVSLIVSELEGIWRAGWNCLATPTEIVLNTERYREYYAWIVSHKRHNCASFFGINVVRNSNEDAPEIWITDYRGPCDCRTCSEAYDG